MSLTTDELRKEVKGELCEGLRFIGRAANLLRHDESNSEAIKTADALAQVTASVTDHIDNLLSK